MAKDETAILARVIDRWRRAVARELSIIEMWRGYAPDVLPTMPWDDPPAGLYSDTTFLVSQLSSRYPKLDPQPLTETYSALKAWHEDKNASRLPDQATLEASADLAMMALQAMEAGLCETPSRQSAADPDCYVTLEQAANMVNRKKSTLEKRKADMPLPDVEGGGGRATEWKWATIRPWLEKTFRRSLPEQFPGDRFIRR